MRSGLHRQKLRVVQLYGSPFRGSLGLLVTAQVGNRYSPRENLDEVLLRFH